MKMLNVNINGNKKLKNNETTRFMIWNLPSVITCPFRTALCEKSCYARKAERIYPQVLPSRMQNLEESKKPDFVENMIFTIESRLNSKSFDGKKVVFRIHESGDFYNREYTEKWVTIARHFENDNRIVFLAYTKSIDYILQCGYRLHMFPKNLVIRSSIWADTNQTWVQFTRHYDFPIYTALTEKEMDEKRERNETFTECHCDDCAKCGKCWDKNEKNIIVKIH